MNNCRKLRAKEYKSNALLLADIKNVPANNQPRNILAYGRYPYPLKYSDKLDISPQFPQLKVADFSANKLKSYQSIWDALLLVMCSILVGLTAVVVLLSR